MVGYVYEYPSQVKVITREIPSQKEKGGGDVDFSDMIYSSIYYTYGFMMDGIEKTHKICIGVSSSYYR